MTIVKRYGERWPRTLENIHKLKTTSCGDPDGVYILYDGSMPLYIGKGNIHHRLYRHRASRSKSRYWDYFSWYEIKNEEMRGEVESILLRMLPFYLRSLNKYRGRLPKAWKRKADDDRPEAIKKDHRPPHRSKRK